jgi:hypothetical protein
MRRGRKWSWRTWPNSNQGNIHMGEGRSRGEEGQGRGGVKKLRNCDKKSKLTVSEVVAVLYILS